MGDLEVFHGGDDKQDYLLSVDEDGKHTLHVRAAGDLAWSEGATLLAVDEVPC